MGQGQLLGRGGNNFGVLRSLGWDPALGSGLCILPLHREGAGGFLPQPGRFWRHRVPEPLGQSWGQWITGMLEQELCLVLSWCSPGLRVGFGVPRRAVLALGPFTRLGEAPTAAGRVGML